MNQLPINASKFGARIYAVSDSEVLIKQTVSRGKAAKYVIDEHREKFVPLNNDSDLAQAVREALLGNL
ncbi:MAG: hypothetical protein IAE77_05220 [Prosthecobacter sp.]|jgi:hypothetical protein|nr:hypothetical protein [Prosthecobacter sp.]